MYVPKPVHEQQAAQTGLKNDGQDGVVFVKAGQASGQAAQNGAANVKETTPSAPQAPAAKASVASKDNAAPAPAQKDTAAPAASPAAKVSAPQTEANAPQAKASAPETGTPQSAPAVRQPEAREGYQVMQPTPAKRNAKETTPQAAAKSPAKAATVKTDDAATTREPASVTPENREEAAAPVNFAAVPSDQTAKNWTEKKAQLNQDSGATIDSTKAAATVGAKDQAQISGVAPEEYALDEEDENHVQDPANTGANTDEGTTAGATADTSDGKVTMPDSYTGDDVEVPLDDSNLQKAVNDVKQAGLQITQDPTKTETVIPEMKDSMQKQLQGDMDSQATKIEQQLSNYEQQKAAYDKAVGSLPDSLSGNTNYTGALTTADGCNNTKGVPARDQELHLGDTLIYCIQPYGKGPGVGGSSTQVSMPIVNTNDLPQDVQRNMAGIIYYGFGGPAGDKGGYSELETHLALSYYYYKNGNNFGGTKGWEQDKEGVTDAVAESWLHYGKVQQLLNDAANFDKDGSIAYKLYSGYPTDAGKWTGNGPQRLFGAKFVNAVQPQVPHFMYHEDKLYTDTPKAIKKVTNDEGFDVNGKKLMRGDKANYKLTWDLSGDKGLDITPDMKVAGLSISDTLPAQVGLDANGITITDGTTQVPMSDVNVQIDGQTVTISAKNPEAFDKQYAGHALTVNLPTTVKVDGYAKALNQYTVNHFGDKHTSNEVVDYIPTVHPEKDVVISVGDQQSINNGTVKLGQLFDYKLESSQRPANYGGDTTQWGIDDHFDTKHDQYTGQYHIYSTAPITLADGTVLPKGTILDKYFAVSFNAQTGDFHAEMLPSLMKILNLPVNKQIAQGWEVFAQCKRIATGTVYNTFTETYNGKVLQSNQVVTHTPDTKTPGTPTTPGTPSHPGTPATPEQPNVPSHPGMPVVQAATIHPATPAGVTPQHQQQQGNQLPDTGDSQHKDWWFIGGALLAGAAGLALKKKREA